MKPKRISSDTLFGGILYDQTMPKNHPFRIIKNAINWSEIRKELQKDNTGKKIKYSHTGAPAVAPLIIFKLLLLQRWHPASDRKVIQRAKTDVSYRFFLDLPLPFPLPDYSNLSKFRKLWGEQKIKKVFDIVFNQIQSYGHADVSQGVAGDITHGHARLQRPTARNLLLDCVRKYLFSFHSFTEVFPTQFNKSLMDSTLKDFQEWEKLYNAKLLSLELSREERLTEVVFKVIEIKKIVTQILTDGNINESNLTKEYYSFIGISELLDQIISENISISTSNDIESKNRPEDQSHDKFKDLPPKRKKGIKNTNSELEDEKISSTESVTSQNTSISQKKGTRKLISIVDPEARIGCKHGKTYFLGPKIPITMTYDGFIADIYAISGSPHDTTQLPTMIENTIQTSGQIPDISANDKGFSSLDNRLYLHSRGIQPGIDFDASSNKRNKNLFSSDKFLVNLTELSVTCPNKIKTFKNTSSPNSTSYTFYFPKEQCVGCPLRKKCTTNKNGRTINVSKFQGILDADKAYLETESYKGVRKYRWQLEGLNGTLKSQEKLGDIPYRGLPKTNVHVQLVGIVRNLKTLTKKIIALLSPTNSIPLIS
ncbi:MAG TPA: transposase [Ignavibacteriaceae bacterium]|nr:transposase [Ignavibacteriaceae bacterium]